MDATVPPTIQAIIDQYRSLCKERDRLEAEFLAVGKKAHRVRIQIRKLLNLLADTTPDHDNRNDAPTQA